MEHHLTQSERLAFAPIAPHILDAATLGEPPEVTTLSTPSGGFRMPSRDAIRLHDARLSAFGGVMSTHEDEEDEEDEESFAQDKEKESFEDYRQELLSERGLSRRALRQEFVSMGMEWND